MAKKKEDKPSGVKKEIRAAAENGTVSKKEFQQIAQSTGASAQQIIKAIDAINQSAKSAGKTPSVGLSSGAANMLINQAQKSPQMMGSTSSIFGGEPAFGTGRIGKSLQSMMGSRPTGGYINPQSGQQSFSTAVPPQLMIGGTMIRPSGSVAVRPMGSAPAIGGATTPTTGTGGAGETTTGVGTSTGGDAFDFQTLLDQMMGMMPDYSGMFADLQGQIASMFDQLSSQFNTPDPLQLAQLGIATNPNAIRAPGGQAKSRIDYLRNALANTVATTAPLAIGGGLTL